MAAAIERAGPLVERHPEKDSSFKALLEQSIGRAMAELVPGSEVRYRSVVVMRETSVTV